MTTRPSHHIAPTAPLADHPDLAPIAGEPEVPAEFFPSLCQYHDAAMVRRAIGRGLEHEWWTVWTAECEQSSPRAVFDALCTLGDVRWRHRTPDQSRKRDWVYRAYISTDDAELRILVQYDSEKDDTVDVNLDACAADLDQARAYRERAIARAPKWERPHEIDTTAITFWSQSRQGMLDSRTVKLPAITWADTAAGYSAETHHALDALMNATADDLPSRLHLWSGVPGTGKTHAIQALGNAWRDWAEIEVVSDPEVFFGSANYMTDLVRSVGGESHHGVIVLEDAGEYLRPDAPAIVGQGFSRLLNITDGMLGSALKIMLLITTNVELRELHPAASRPGRAASNIAFTPLTVEESIAWLGAQGFTGPMPDAPMTLAELYALLTQSGPIQARATRPAVGFTAA